VTMINYNKLILLSMLKLYFCDIMIDLIVIKIIIYLI